MIDYVTASITSSMHLDYETNHPSTPYASSSFAEDGPATTVAPSMLKSLMKWDVTVPTAFATFPTRPLGAT